MASDPTSVNNDATNANNNGNGPVVNPLYTAEAAYNIFYKEHIYDNSLEGSDRNFNEYLRERKNALGYKYGDDVNKLERDVKAIRTRERAATFKKFKDQIHRMRLQMLHDKLQLAALIYAEGGRNISGNDPKYIMPGEEMLGIGFSVRQRAMYVGPAPINGANADGDIQSVISAKNKNGGYEYVAYMGSDYNNMLNNHFPDSYPALRAAIAALKAAEITYSATTIPEQYKHYLSFNKSDKRSPYARECTNGAPKPPNRATGDKTFFWGITEACGKDPYLNPDKKPSGTSTDKKSSSSALNQHFASGAADRSGNPFRA